MAHGKYSARMPFLADLRDYEYYRPSANTQAFGSPDLHAAHVQDRITPGAPKHAAAKRLKQVAGGELEVVVEGWRT